MNIYLGIIGLIIVVMFLLNAYNNNEKKKSIKVFYVGVDKRVRVKFVKPDKETVTFNGKAYLLSYEKMFFHNGIASIFVNYKNAETLDLLDLNKVIYSAEDYNTAISSKVGSELFEASKPKEVINLTNMLLILVIVAVGYLAFSLNSEISSIREVIDTINEIIGGSINE